MKRYWLHDWLNRNDPHHAMLLVVEAHVIERPHEWEWSDYTAVNHAQRLCLWIANEAYGMKLRDSVNWQSGPQIELTAKWRRRLWAAVKGRAIAPTRAKEIVSRFKEREAANSNVVPLHGTNA